MEPLRTPLYGCQQISIFVWLISLLNVHTHTHTHTRARAHTHKAKFLVFGMGIKIHYRLIECLRVYGIFVEMVVILFMLVLDLAARLQELKKDDETIDGFGKAMKDWVRHFRFCVHSLHIHRKLKSEWFSYSNYFLYIMPLPLVCYCSSKSRRKLKI